MIKDQPTANAAPPAAVTARRSRRRASKTTGLTASTGGISPRVRGGTHQITGGGRPVMPASEKPIAAAAAKKKENSALTKPTTIAQPTAQFREGKIDRQSNPQP